MCILSAALRIKKQATRQELATSEYCMLRRWRGVSWSWRARGAS